MTAEDRRLCALAAALAPREAAAWLRRAPAPEAPDAAARLAALPRSARLAALAAATPPSPRASRRSTAERGPVAAVLDALGAGRVPEGVAPLLVRVCRERLAGARDPASP